MTHGFCLPDRPLLVTASLSLALFPSFMIASLGYPQGPTQGSIVNGSVDTSHITRLIVQSICRVIRTVDFFGTELRRCKCKLVLHPNWAPNRVVGCISEEFHRIVFCSCGARTAAPTVKACGQHRAPSSTQNTSK